MRVLFIFLPQAKHIEFCQGHFRAHQDDELRPHLATRRATEQRADQREPAHDRDTGRVLALGVLDQAAQDNGHTR